MALLKAKWHSLFGIMVEDQQQNGLSSRFPSCSLQPATESQGTVARYLTRSMTRSLGAALTASSFIMTISSPGMSLPSEGPPAQEAELRVLSRACLKVFMYARLKSQTILNS